MPLEKENKSKIRNFVIISHIDHGKSTLADRFLELTNTLPKDKITPQYLDRMGLEKKHGVTIKMHPVRMVWQDKDSQLKYILNLIDTPGHADFSYEVSRALAAVEGAILLVDATQGIQAQTIFNLEMAQREKLVIIPAINKIDLESAQQDKTKKEILDILGNKIDDDIIAISAKRGDGVISLIEKIIEKIPSPQINFELPFKALVFDSLYDIYQGVVVYVRVIDGQIKNNDRIYFLREGIEARVQEVGIFSPNLQKTDVLESGQIGYIKTGIKEVERIKVGDTIALSDYREKISPLPGFQVPKPIIFSDFFPQDSNDFDIFKKGILNLHLNDSSFTFTPQEREFIGRGYRLGFLGLFHLQIISERLTEDCRIDLIITHPTVSYKILTLDGKEIIANCPEDFPESFLKVYELFCKVDIITPAIYLNKIYNLINNFGAEIIETKNISGFDKLNLIIKLPLRRLMENFYDELKSASSGFASMNWEILDWQESDLIKLDILIAGRKESSLARIVEKNNAEKEGRKMVQKLKEYFPPQLFPVPLQASIGGKIIARETVKALRKDVTAPLYGGDVSRKKKLLEKQKAGKKKLAKVGKINIPSEVIIKMLK